MERKNILKIILIFFVILFLVLQVKVLGFYTDNSLQTVEYTEEYKEWLNMNDDEKQNYIMPRMYAIDVNEINTDYSRISGLKSSLITAKFMISNYKTYDLRDNITVAVKDQRSTGQCWAFAMNSAIESNIEKTTNEVSKIFSPRYVEYATARTFLDGTNSKSYNREVGYGGFAEIALGLYTSGRGPVLESDFPFENNENKIKLTEIQNLETQKQIKAYKRFTPIYKTYTNGNVECTDSYGNVYTDEQVTKIRDEIKEHILKYGAIVSQTYGVGGVSGSASKYYNKPNQVLQSTAYFCNNPSLSADHQITIIGWDDNYAVTNFNSSYRPSTPGAYIVLNSWGESFGENGIYYISYEDCFIEKNLLGIISVTDIEYDNIYQYDELGNNYTIAANQDIYGANVFERTNSSKSEFLTQISVASLIDVNCDIYVNSVDGELSEAKLKKVATNIKIENGYYTIDLDTPIELTGDKFVVAVKYYANDSGISYVGLEYPDGYYWNTATAENGQSYVSLDLNNWDDILNLASATAIPSQANLCIKAFSELKEEKEDNEEDEYFNINDYKINDEYIYGISPETKLSDFINNISTNQEYYIYGKNENLLQSSEIISTGAKFQIGNKTYKLVVKGDLNGDGKISITDVVKARLHVSSIIVLEKEFLKAADVNEDGKVSITDLVKINLANIDMIKI